MLINTPTSAPPDQNRRFAQCRPFSVSSFDVEGRISRAGVEIQIQRYKWDEPLPDGLFKPPVCYVDLALIPRVPAAEASYPRTAMRRGPVYAFIGDCVFIPAGHEIKAHNPAVEHRVLACLFDANKMDPYLEADGSRIELAACFNIKNPHIRACLARLAEEVLAPGFASEVLVDSTVTSLIVELSRHFRGARTAGTAVGSRLPMRHLRLIQERIESTKGPAPSLAALAAGCGISSRHLTRSFKNTTGRTLSEYAAEVRLRRAKELLLDRSLLIKSIAYESGFHSQAAFAAAFRKATGWTPREFRRETLGGPDEPMSA